MFFGKYEEPNFLYRVYLSFVLFNHFEVPPFAILS